jgi:hypothetical protein
MDIINTIHDTLVNKWTIGGSLVLLSGVHFVGGGLSDFMEMTLFGQSWLTVGRLVAVLPLALGLAILLKGLPGVGAYSDLLDVKGEISSA